MPVLKVASIASSLPAQRRLTMLCALGCVAQKSDLHQVGWNRDTVCYPTNACFGMNPVPAIPGYRWRYNLELGSGAGFELFLGRRLGRLRAELSATFARHDLTQNFAGIEYLDGGPILPAESSAYARTESAVKDISVRVLSLDIYRDFPIGDRLGGYIGAGAGAAFARVNGLYFNSEYGDSSPTAYDPPLSFYTSRANRDLSDTLLTGRLHAGIDYPLNERRLLGVKLTWSYAEGISRAAPYAVHPMHERDPDFSSRTDYDPVRGWSLAATLKWRAGE